ncbi:D-arabinono-1,4-lactone oxidase [Salinispira pacifica]|uniref:D-arabinono-1,4-lactone oxidase n=1 Tax=Salinispira pacifica TaxID=1307761 RepID=UPI000415F463|nr:D-arabinono-1,4-lactone oxidase [Salinispira pacifica]
MHTGSLYESTVTKKRSSTLELAEWTADQKDYSELFLNFRSALESDPRAFAHIPMDIRFLSGDGSWLSNAYDRDIVTMGCVTRKPYAADRYRAFDIIEEQFLSFGGRPHWAKRFKAGRETLEKLYPKYEEFVALRRDMDPDGKFLNSYLGELFS